MAAEYDHSVLETCERLGIEMKELEDWNCCGASSAHSTNHLLSLAIPARNLAIAEEQGLDVVAPCAACFQRLITVQHETRKDPKIKEKVNKVLGGRTYEAKTEVKSILDVLNEYGIDNLAAKVVKPLSGLKVACYYGCYLVKPPKVCHVDDAENPMSMDKIMAAIGAQPVQWPYKTECCGGSLVLSNPDIVLKLGRDILQMATDAGANCIVTPCPLCQPNLDTRECQVNKKYGTNFNIPVFYITELIALALGAHKNSLKLHKHLTDPTELLKAI